MNIFSFEYIVYSWEWFTVHFCKFYMCVFDIIAINKSIMCDINDWMADCTHVQLQP